MRCDSKKEEDTRCLQLGLPYEVIVDARFTVKLRSLELSVDVDTQLIKRDFSFTQ